MQKYTSIRYEARQLIGSGRLAETWETLDKAKKGIDKADIFNHFVTKGKQVVWAEIGDDGKAHLVKKTFK